METSLTFEVHSVFYKVHDWGFAHTGASASSSSKWRGWLINARPREFQSGATWFCRSL